MHRPAMASLFLVFLSLAISRPAHGQPATREGCHTQFRQAHVEISQILDARRRAHDRAFEVHITSITAAQPLWREVDRLDGLFDEKLSQARDQLDACLARVPRERSEENNPRREFDIVQSSIRQLQRAGLRPMNPTVRRIINNSLREARQRARNSLDTLAQVTKHIDLIRITGGLPALPPVAPPPPPPQQGPPVSLPNTTLGDVFRQIGREPDHQRPGPPSESIGGKGSSRPEAIGPVENPRHSTPSQPPPPNPPQDNLFPGETCHQPPAHLESSYRSGAIFNDPQYAQDFARSRARGWIYRVRTNSRGQTELCLRNPREYQELQRR